MSFIIQEISDRPMKIRDKNLVIIPATILPIDSKRLSIGDYVGMKSGLRIHLIDFGGFIGAIPEAKDAYFLSDAMPATFNQDAKMASSGEVFIPIGTPCVAEYAIGNNVCSDKWPASLNNYWITTAIYCKDDMVGFGWFRNGESTSEIIIINGSVDSKESIKVRAVRKLFGSTIECDSLVFKRIECWEYEVDK